MYGGKGHIDIGVELYYKQCIMDFNPSSADSAKFHSWIYRCIHLYFKPVIHFMRPAILCDELPGAVLGK
jgi:hypothetical protein